MEYCNDGDLSGFIKNHSKINKYIPEEKIWKIFIQICIGLHQIHSKKILHRDLKTMNIFLIKKCSVEKSISYKKHLSILLISNK